MPKLFGLRLPSWMDRMALWRAQKIIQHFPNDLRGLVLDVGCGDGSVTDALSKEKGVTVWGVDVVNNFRYGFSFQVGDGSHLPYRDQSFDAVLLIYVLHHCSDIEEVLKECQRVSKGTIILQEDVPTNPWNKWLTHFLDCLGNTVVLGLLSLFKHGGWQLMKVPYNFRNDDEWKECFRAMGLKLIEAKKISLGPFDPVPHRQYVVRVDAGASSN